MTPIRILAIALIVAGGLGLAYGQFSYTRDTHKAALGPIELSVKDTQTVQVPTWVGGGALAFGVLLLVLGSRKP